MENEKIKNDGPYIPQKPRKLTKREYDEFFEIYKKSSCLVSTACSAFGVSRATFYARRRDDPVFDARCTDVEEMVKDFGEAALLKKIKEGDTTCIIFFAKTKLKDRGYTERHEVTGANGSALVPQKEIDLDKLTPEQRAVLLSIGEDVINDKGE